MNGHLRLIDWLELHEKIHASSRALPVGQAA
jgi:hypothetical protein